MDGSVTGAYLKEGFNYRKACVRLHSRPPGDRLTLRGFGDEKAERFRQVMLAVGRIKRRWGKDTVCFAVVNSEGRRGTKFEKRSPRYTTRPQEVLTIE